MTSQWYQPDDNQMAQENNNTTRADEHGVPDDDLARAESDRTERDRPMSFAHAAVAPADLEPADLEPEAFAVSDLPGSAPAGHGADEPGMSDSEIVSPSLTAVAAVAASSATESPLAGNTTTAAGPWSEIQARFVDDPRASVELAAGLVDDRVAALAASVRNRQESLRSAWQGEDAGTEEMRVTLQHYRALWHRLEDYPAE